MRVLAVVVALAFCSGCWVLDELDEGMQKVDAHRPRAKSTEAQHEEDGPPEEKAPLTRTANPGPSRLERLKEWAAKKLGPAPEPPDPNDAVVGCVLGGASHFTRRYDCETRGGRVVELDGAGQ